jgi:hypothetical protein
LATAVKLNVLEFWPSHGGSGSLEHDVKVAIDAESRSQRSDFQMLWAKVIEHRGRAVE